MNRRFFIDNRFQVDPQTNLVIDKTAGTSLRLEPRLIELLCILSTSAGQTVLRETLIEKIWNNYPGGDEGLTQGISALRKVFLDERKELIQTVPKKGYVFRGAIKYVESGSGSHRPKSSLSIWGIGVAIMVAVISILIAYTIFQDAKQQESQVSKVSYPAKLESFERAEENPLNTAVTNGPDGTRYKLVMIDDRPPSFYVNDTRLPEDKWESHMTLINFLKNELKTRQMRKTD